MYSGCLLHWLGARHPTIHAHSRRFLLLFSATAAGVKHAPPAFENPS